MALLSHILRQLRPEVHSNSPPPPSTAASTPSHLQRVPSSELPLPPTKRVRLDDSSQSALGSVEQDLVYCCQADLPRKMEKYWAQRKRLFSRFDEGIKLDRESWYSVTPEKIARQIAARCSCEVVVDAFCGAGGNAIQFASTCDKVIAIDIDPNKVKLAQSNAKIYGVDNKIEFICTDFLEWIQKQKPGSVDVIFLSPPWGGMNYLSLNRPYYSLQDLKPVHGRDLVKMSQKITPQVSIYLPRHLDVMGLSELVGPEECVEVEEEWMGQKCKALTVYLGNLSSIHLDEHQ